MYSNYAPFSLRTQLSVDATIEGIPTLGTVAAADNFYDEISQEEALEIEGAKSMLNQEILELEKRPFDDEEGIDSDHEGII
jgi:hypothetical protein